MATLKDRNERDYRLVSSSLGQVDPDRLNFNKIKVGNKYLSNDVTLNTSFFKKRGNERPIDKEMVERAISTQDIQTMRYISDYFFKTSGIYSRLCRYMAYLYRYDWIITPVVLDDKIKNEKVIEGWYKASLHLEKCNLRKIFGDIALSVIKNGCYYGYKITQKDATYLQELPANYCRTRYTLNGKPAVEFNVKYFQDMFADIEYRIKILKMFPKEFQKAYVSFQKGTLPKDFQGDQNGWFLLDPAKAVKFNISMSDAPLFMPIIPKLIDLDEAQDLDREKMKQQILKIIIQEMPIDKNGDLIFDVQEANALHQNAVAMLSDAIGVDVLTTFADIQVADMSDKGNVSSVDQLDKVERTVYNEAGVSQMQFNTNGNLALEKSIANDEATMTDLLLQFEEYAESLLFFVNGKPKRLQYKVQMLPTTVYNYKDLSKLYKEQTMIGFSKLLPQVALGQTQLNVMSTAYFENELLNLDELFVAPQMSSTMSSKDSNESTSLGSKGEEGQGRTELEVQEKSEKTIQNLESAS